jgi:hypothetical protein
MINNIIGYLFCGLVWDVVLNFVSTITEHKHKLDNKERLFSLVLWPISFCIFTYHFVKTFFGK